MIRTLLFPLLVLISLSMTVLADGLANEIILTPRWRDLQSSYSPLTNPAFIMSEDYKTLRGAFALSMNGAFWLTEIGGVMPIFDTAISLLNNKFQAVGITYAGEGAGNIEAYQWDALGRPVSNPTVNYSHNSFSLSYGINPWRALDVGINVDMSYQTDFGTSLFDMGMDLGAAYTIDNFPFFGRRIGKHTIALSLLNPFDIRLHDQPSYTRDFRLSWLVDYAHVEYFDLQFGLQYDVKNYLFKSERKGQPNAIEQDVSLRIGLTKILDILQVYCLAGSGYWGIAAGVDFSIAKPDSSRRRPDLSPAIPDTFQAQELRHNTMCADYQFMMTDSKAAPSQTFYLRNQFGKSRMSVSDNDLYIKAMKAYIERKYWDAYGLFSKLVTYYPKFIRNNIARFYLSESLERLRMNDIAITHYENAKSEYQKDGKIDDDFVIPASDLGIMRIYYREGNSEGVRKQFDKLNHRSIPDSIKFNAYYLMGQTTFSAGEFDKAVPLFEAIPEEHSQYPFARYSMAITYVLQDSLLVAVKDPLSYCIRFTPPKGEKMTNGQKDIINKAYVKMGNFFYQDKKFSKAAWFLSQVPKGSYYYNEAAVCKGWCAVQSALENGKWDSCVTIGSEIKNDAKEIVLKKEGALIAAYALMFKKNYKAAFSILKEIENQVIDTLSPSDLLARKEAFGQIQTRYKILAQKSDQVALAKDTADRARILDSLHTDQESMLDSIIIFLNFFDYYNRMAYLNKNREGTNEDVKYMLGKLSVLMKIENEKGRYKNGETEKAEIDKKIKELQDELNRQKRPSGNVPAQMPAEPETAPSVKDKLRQSVQQDTLKSGGGRDSTENQKEPGKGNQNDSTGASPH